MYDWYIEQINITFQKDTYYIYHGISGAEHILLWGSSPLHSTMVVGVWVFGWV
jgi:hypothetical protein